jgi:hypothetical protein
MHQRNDKSNEPEPCRTRANTNTEAVTNQIPNDCDVPTKLDPKEIKTNHRVYQIVYQMASQETVETTTKRY